MPQERPESKHLTRLGYLKPNTILVESILIGIEAIEVLPWCQASCCRVHGSILLVPEHHPIARSAFSVGFLTLAAGWLLLIAFQFAAAAGQASRG